MKYLVCLLLLAVVLSVASAGYIGHGHGWGYAPSYYRSYHYPAYGYRSYGHYGYGGWGGRYGGYGGWW